MDTERVEQAQRSERGPVLLAWATLGFSALTTAAGLAYSLWLGEGVDFFLAAGLSFPVLGALVASRQPRNSEAWVMLGIGLVFGLFTVIGVYSDYGLSLIHI